MNIPVSHHYPIKCQTNSSSRIARVSVLLLPTKGAPFSGKTHGKLSKSNDFLMMLPVNIAVLGYISNFWTYHLTQVSHLDSRIVLPRFTMLKWRVPTRVRQWQDDQVPLPEVFGSSRSFEACSYWRKRFQDISSLHLPFAIVSVGHDHHYYV